MTSYRTDGKVGPWAAEKLECLRKYLGPYTTILKGQSWCEAYYYIDAFAGSGRAEVRALTPSVKAGEPRLFDDIYQSLDVQSYVDGSPRVALEIEHPFSKYVFVEQNSKHALQLQELRDEYPDKSIDVVEGDANVALNDFVLRSGINWKKARAVAFLDPFGMQVRWTTIETLARTQAIEVIVNNPIPMAVQRLLSRDANLPDRWIALLNGYFGTPDWEDVVYEKTSDLFGESIHKRSASAPALGRFYSDRLRQEFGYAASARVVRNTRGTELYYLHWAGPNKTGLKIANHVLSQGETIKLRP